MKQHQLIMIVALITTVMCGSVVGDYQDDRLFGNGRFFRRLRDDVTGRKQPKVDTKKGQKPAAADRRTTGKTPTPANRAGVKTPTPAVRPGQAPVPDPRNSQSRTAPTRASHPRSNQPVPVAGKQAVAQRTTKKATIGFGMLLELRAKQLVVTKLDPRGNAYQAGIRQGDVVIDAGGMELTSLDEFNEVADILGQGDQLEFEIARRGKKEKVLIQFGTAPKEGKIAETKPAKNTIPAKKNDYSFVPETDEISRGGMRSVLEPAQRNNRIKPQPVPQSIRTSKLQVPNRDARSNDQQTIERQSEKIRQMQLEIERLRTGGRSALESGPSLSGPGN